MVLTTTTSQRSLISAVSSRGPAMRCVTDCYMWLDTRLLWLFWVLPQLRSGSHCLRRAIAGPKGWLESRCCCWAFMCLALFFDLLRTLTDPKPGSLYWPTASFG